MPLFVSFYFCAWPRGAPREGDGRADVHWKGHKGGWHQDARRDGQDGDARIGQDVPVSPLPLGEARQGMDHS